MVMLGNPEISAHTPHQCTKCKQTCPLSDYTWHLADFKDSDLHRYVTNCYRVCPNCQHEELTSSVTEYGEVLFELATAAH